MEKKKQPKVNKLITLLLLISMFTFLMETEQRIADFVRTNLTDRVFFHSDETEEIAEKDSINPYMQRSNFISTLVNSIKANSVSDN